jgi:hypothetical protein
MRRQKEEGSEAGFIRLADAAGAVLAGAVAPGRRALGAILPVQVAETCPKPQPQPAELKTTRSPNSREQGQRLLTDYFNSLPRTTK